MTASGLAQRRRHRTLSAFGVGLLSLLILPILGWIAVDTLRSSKEGKDALAGLTPLVSIPPTPAALLGVLDDGGQVATLAVVALAPPASAGEPAAGGTVVVVPAGGDTYLPDGTRGRVGDAYAQGGLEGLTTTAEGLLGITFSAADVVPAAGLAELLAPLGAVEVDLPRPVLADQRGTTVERYPAGTTTLDPDGIGAVLAATSSTEGEVDRLPVVDAVWRGIAARVGQGLSTGPPPSDASVPATPTDVQGFLERLLAGPVQVHTLTVEQVTDPTANPDGLDLLRLDTGEVTVVMATVAPSAVSPPFPTLSLYVKSSLGDPALTKLAVEQLLLAGANVVLVTENPDEDPPAQTVVEYADPNDAAAAERFAAQLGTFSSRLADVRIDGIDATFVLGESYRAEQSTTVPGSALPTTDTTDTTDATDTTDSSTTETTDP